MTQKQKKKTFTPKLTTLFSNITSKSLKERKDELDSLPIEERLKKHIVDGEKNNFENNLKLALKKYKHEIVDHKRIKQILLTLKRKSIKNNIDPKITNRIWKNMIMSYIDYEKRNFKKK